MGMSWGDDCERHKEMSKKRFNHTSRMGLV